MPPSQEIATVSALLIEHAFGNDPFETLSIDLSEADIAPDKSLEELYCFFAFGAVRMVHRAVDDPQMRDRSVLAFVSLVTEALLARQGYSVDHPDAESRAAAWRQTFANRFDEYEAALHDSTRDPGGRLFHTTAIALEHVLGREHKDAVGCLSILGSWNALCTAISESAADVASAP